MPTGYTAKLAEHGQSFNEFVLQCARGMGALIMMRDDPWDAPILEFQPSDFYAKELEKAKAEHERLLAMSDAERIEFGEKAKRDSIKMHEDWLAKDQAQNKRLIEMKTKVREWSPPTSEHVGFKKFMLEQLDTSIQSDGYIRKEIAKARTKFARDYFDEALASAAQNIPRYEEEQRKEVERTEGRNRWVRELKASLGLAQPRRRE